jgi:hypothetical protein
MRHIRSIVVFNSATAGDFLTSLCWSQLDLPTNLFDQQQSGRMTIQNFYFKDITTRLYHDPEIESTLDFSRMFPVENSHYWLECYKELADRCVFIDYPEHIQPYIMEIYLEKVFDNNKQKMIDLNLPNLHPYIASQVSVHNIDKILNIQWQKNIKGWRVNPNLSAVNLSEFFDQHKMQRMVEKLINQSLTDQSKFDLIYKNWISRNKKLSELF